MNAEEETTKDAKDAKMGTDIIFKEESYRIIGASINPAREAGRIFRAFRVFRS